ncbi:hypothetical protein GF322_04860 [Candidatus Dependentiae bacterium]|nr:hypothetical protein [Candidatus Dependentiae bacterium]
MLIISEFLANSIIWLIYTFFSLSLVPQIILNYKRKKNKGLSDSFLAASISFQAFYVFYAFFCNLPLAYKLMNSIYLFLTCVLVLQRLLYYKSAARRRKLYSFYLFNIFLILSFIVFAIGFMNFKNPLIGWIFVSFNTFRNVIPMFDGFLNKSLKGISASFILLSLLSYSFEMLASLALNLPVQITVNDAFSILIYFILFLEYKVYKKGIKYTKVGRKKLKTYAQSS